MRAIHESSTPARTNFPRMVKRRMVEELTGEPVAWTEELDVMISAFKPDLKPWDVGPSTRALAETCLVLFNSNEFLYVR
jgi:hypothetical protein